MQSPPIPADEAERVAALRRLNVLDTMAEERFDRFTRLARRLFHVPIALVTLVDSDRQWFKSCQGLGIRETPRDISFCGHAILDEEVMVVPDTRRDARFEDNPLVLDEPFIRFYAGCPLHAPDGERIGTLCLIGREPRSLEPEDRSLLGDLARMVELDLAVATMATTDELTGLSNRRGFREIARPALARAARSDSNATLIYFDLDDFKPINDAFGHAEGDRALQEFARLLLSAFRESDIVARLGGDEFCVLLTVVEAPGVVRAIARFDQALDAHNAEAGRRYRLRYSAGTAEMEADDAHDPSRLVARADQAMYAAKHVRRGQSAPRR